MGDHSDNNIAVTALVVALCSLIFTAGQLLGQYFATADGHRRCQPSVMGQWAKKTRLRWRWSQFRFEILFTTPEIRLQQWLGPRAAKNDIWIDGSEDSKTRTMVDDFLFQSGSDERVCWLSFLASLHSQENKLEILGCYRSLRDSRILPPPTLVRPTLRFREWSWDFMSPDIVRPFAVTNVCDIAVLVRRLGMTWSDFRPEENILRAEGNRHLITSTVARSIGIILHYTNYRANKDLQMFDGKEMLPSIVTYIPSSEADRMGFGILPGFKHFGIPDFKMGTIEEVYETMNTLDRSGKASKTLKDVRSLVPRVTFGFSDLIPLAAPMLRRRGSTVIRVPIPTEYCVGLTCHTEGFVVFRHRLEEYIGSRDVDAVTPQTRWVLRKYEELAQYPEWEDEILANDQSNSRNLRFLEDVHTCWDEATDYFYKMQRGSLFNYYDLMASHVRHAVNYWGDAWSHLRGDDGKQAHNDYGPQLRDWIAEGAHMYWDYLPRIAQDIKNKGFDDEAQVHEAWFTMMLRAFCWWRCHYLNPGQDMIHSPSILPSRYWDSKLPVYIG